MKFSLLHLRELVHVQRSQEFLQLYNYVSFPAFKTTCTHNQAHLKFEGLLAYVILFTRALSAVITPNHAKTAPKYKPEAHTPNLT